MDLIQDWSSYLLSPANPFQSYFFQLLSYKSIFKAYTAPLFTALTQKPDLATLALLLLILFLTLKILNMLVSTVVFWFRLAFRVVFWGGLAVAGFYMWTRGPEGMVADVSYWGGIWRQEYKFWLENREQRMALGNQQPWS